MNTILFSSRLRMQAPALLLALGSLGAAWAQADPPSTAQAPTELTTSTDFLSDDNWRRLPREERRRRSRDSYIARFEPGGKPSIDRLADYVDRYARTNIYDPRLTVFRVTAKHVPGTTGSVVLAGEVLLPQYRKGVQNTLEMLGFNVERNEIVVLPAAGLGTEIYALSTTAAATVRRDPRPQAEQVTSVGMGNWVRLLRAARTEDVTSTAPHRSALRDDYAGPWYLAQTAEGYIGFMRDDELKRVAELRRPDAMVLLPTTATLAGGGPEERQIPVPAGAFVHRADGAPGASARYRLTHADALLPESAVVAELNRPAFTEEQILKLAEPLLGVKYVWGGVTNQGIDCSGFTQFMLRTKGITLPRDAEEQATVGQLVAFGPDVARLAQPGDLVFFANDRGKISHIAMSLGNGRVIHSAGKGVHISSLLEEKDDEDDARPMIDRVVFARRVVGQ